jgi:hypothetical protein
MSMMAVGMTTDFHLCSNVGRCVRAAFVQHLIDGVKAMTELQTRVLGVEARSWLKSLLVYGTLCKILLERLDFDVGRILTFVPPSASDDAVKAFEWSIQSASRVAPTARDSNSKAVGYEILTPALASSIRKYLRERSEHVCIFEDQIARPSDGRLLRSQTTVTTFGESVYHVLSPPDIYTDRIDRTVDVVSRPYPPLIGVMTKCLASVFGPPLTHEMLVDLADNAALIAVGAYDGEGFLLWDRHIAME